MGSGPQTEASTPQCVLILRGHTLTFVIKFKCRGNECCADKEGESESTRGSLLVHNEEYTMWMTKQRRGPPRAPCPMRTATWWSLPREAGVGGKSSTCRRHLHRDLLKLHHFNWCRASKTTLMERASCIEIPRMVTSLQ